MTYIAKAEKLLELIKELAPYMTVEQVSSKVTERLLKESKKEPFAEGPK